MNDFNFVFAWIAALLGICVTGLVYVLGGRSAAACFVFACFWFWAGFWFREFLGGRHG